ncbi:hypothetical protein AVO42_02095 [Thiomicrospira sp. XS5]|uniref:hypothetical protein n=1 Tax=Thiomicrospira sp. XS5 TaxID=1775636 RepID=UPI00074AA362|nr:hypothetical protein [Thiomicrospira sp. XS5]KUJ74231.1 hypothetical protein AVO42_02095 [Thiomicrospira sp. XS5]
MQYVLWICLALIWSFNAQAHGVNLAPQDTEYAIWSSASFTWNSNGAVGNNEYWRIPGLMMGGDATPAKEGLNLDDALLGGHYAFNDKAKVTAKLGVHSDDGDHHAAVNLENLFVSYQMVQSFGVSLGQMEANFSPTASYHASLQPMAEAPLVADAFWGRSFHDVGVNAVWKPVPQLTIGLEAWDGQSFPATPGDQGGAQDIYLQWLQHWQGWHLQAGIWGMRAQAYQRGDDRYTAGHSHSSDFETLPTDVRFTGDTTLTGLWLQVMTPTWQAWQFQLLAELVHSESDGDILDATRQADYTNDNYGYYVMPTLVWGNHQFSYRYEMLYLKNDVTGAAAGILAKEANLINDKDPSRQTVQWRWQMSRNFAWRLAYVYDDTLPESTERYSLGVVWQSLLFSSL